MGHRDSHENLRRREFGAGSGRERRDGFTTEGRTDHDTRAYQTGGRDRINLNRGPIAGGTPDFICDEYIQPKLQPSRIGFVEHRDLYGVLVSLTLHIRF
jgi:hypothetical protein